ncbi:MAG: hypothetical protein AAGD86_03575 [Pseudomonadota bacterium]
MPQPLAIGTIVGVLACLLLGAVLLTRRRTVCDPDRFDGWLGVPVIACIPRGDQGDGKGDGLLDPEASDDLALDGVRSLTTAVHLMTLQHEACSIALTAIAPGAGSAFVGANLAAAAASPGRGALLIDGDLTGGRVHQSLKAEAAPGLADVVAKRVDLATATQRLNAELDLLPTGSAEGGVERSPADPLGADAVASVIGEAMKLKPFVAVVTAPATAPAAAAAIAARCTLAFVVARSGRHTQADIDGALRALEQHGGKPVGLIFNGLPVRAADYEAAAA